MTLRHAGLLGFVMASGFLIVGQIYMVIPLIEDIAARFDVSPANAGFVGTAFGFAYAAGFLVFGPLSDRFGRRRVIVLGLIATALATLLVAFAQNFGLLLAARAVQGFAASTFPPAALSLVAEDLPPRQRAFGISLMSFAFLGAAPLSQFLAAQVSGGLPAIMLWLAPLYLFGAAGMFFTARSVSSVASSEGAGTEQRTRPLLHDPGIIAAWAAAGTVLFGFVSFHAGAQALGVVRNFDLQVLRLVGLPTLLLTFAATPLTRRHGAPVTARIGLGLAALALGIAATGVSALVTTASVLLSAGVALAVPGLIATVAGRASDGNRGLALAIYSFLLFFGASIAPPVAHALMQTGSVAGWLLPASLFALAAIGLTVFTPISQRPPGR
ncbi:MFS transporter [Pseudogemmobacter sonorensis]|uniref:MFS transporter n=1 Tax=Pseudogemmobacter sonorensis TaxID=2989681 RepID=UPI0036970B5C